MGVFNPLTTRGSENLKFDFAGDDDDEDEKPKLLLLLPLANILGLMFSFLAAVLKVASLVVFDVINAF